MMKDDFLTDLWLRLVRGLFGVFMILYVADFIFFAFSAAQGEAGIIYIVSFAAHILLYPIILFPLLIFLILGVLTRLPLRPVLKVIALIAVLDGAKAFVYRGSHPFYTVAAQEYTRKYHRYQAEHDPPFSETDIYYPTSFESDVKYLGGLRVRRDRTTTAEVQAFFEGSPYLYLTFLVPRNISLSGRDFQYDRLIEYRARGTAAFVFFLYQDKLMHCVYFPSEKEFTPPANSGCVRAGKQDAKTIYREGLAYCSQRNRSFQELHHCAAKEKSLNVQ